MRYALLNANDTVLLHREFDAQPRDPIGKNWRWVEDPYIPPPPPPPPTPEQLADQFFEIDGRTDTLELALRAVISLLADRMGVTDAQAKTAMRNRMLAIAKGDRG